MIVPIPQFIFSMKGSGMFRFDIVCKNTLGLLNDHGKNVTTMLRFKSMVIEWNITVYEIVVKIAKKKDGK